METQSSHYSQVSSQGRLFVLITVLNICLLCLTLYHSTLQVSHNAVFDIIQSSILTFNYSKVLASRTLACGFGVFL